MKSEADARLEQLTNWLGSIAAINMTGIAPASADASFRRYFRVGLDDGSTLIAMDAPPAQEDCRPFIDVTQRLEAAGLHVPHIHATNIEAGFLLLEDLGSENYLDRLTAQTADKLYGEAITALVALQSARTAGLPAYDQQLLKTELDLFTDWFLGEHLRLILNHRQQKLLEDIHDQLIASALEQPRVFVHRDFHSRNLMVLEAGSPGIIDHQDAVSGPVTYDLVSLLRDCYIDWPQQQIDSWARLFFNQAVTAGTLSNISFDSFQRWFDLMGIQRHLKAIGIFARLNCRDGKPGYLGDIPRTLGYVTKVAARHPETTALAGLINELDITSRVTA